MAICLNVDKKLTFPTKEVFVRSPEYTWGISETIVTNTSSKNEAEVVFYLGKDESTLTFIGRYTLAPLNELDQSTIYKGFLNENEAVYVELIRGEISVRSAGTFDSISLTDATGSQMGYTKKQLDELVKELKNEVYKAIETGIIPPPSSPNISPPTNVGIKPNIGTVIHNVPAIVDESKNYSISFYGVTDPGGDLVQFKIVNIKGGIVFTKTQRITPNETITLISPPVNENTQGSFELIAISSQSVASDPLKINVIIKDTTIPLGLPNVANATSTLPSAITEKEQVEVFFSNISDNLNTEIKLDLSSTGPITLSKNTNLAIGEKIVVTANEVMVDTLAAIEVIAKNASGSSVKKFETTVKNILINQAPDITNLNWSGPPVIYDNSKITVGFYGAIDPEGGLVTYKIDTIQGPITFNKTTNISNTDNVELSVGNILNDTGASFKLYAIDNKGLSSSAKTIAINVKKTIVVEPINIPPNITNLDWYGPVYLNDDTEAVVSFFGVTDQEDGSNVKYTITEISPSGIISFSKTTNISSSDEIRIFPTKVLSDTVISFKVHATDTLGESSNKKNFSFTLKRTSL